jgi:hypothetical protein
MTSKFAITLIIAASLSTSCVQATEVIGVPFKNGVVVVADKHLEHNTLDNKTGKKKTAYSDEALKVQCAAI